MTTKNFVAIERDMLPHLNGFSMSGRLMFITPLKHILRGLNFEPSAFDKRSFSVTAFVMPLFVPSEHLTLNFADRVRHQGNGDRWNLDMPDLKTELSKALNQKAVPYLESIHSVHNFLRFATESLKDSAAALQFKNPHIQQAIAYAQTSVGQFQESHQTLTKLIEQLDSKIYWQRDIAERAETLKNQIEVNPVGAQKILDAWEADTIKNIGLESFQK
jgi:hypothetical protein